MKIIPYWKNIKDDLNKWRNIKLLIGSVDSMKMSILPILIKPNSNENPKNIFHETWQANSRIKMEQQSVKKNGQVSMRKKCKVRRNALLDIKT